MLARSGLHRWTGLLFVLVARADILPGAEPAPAIEVVIDSRVELVSIVERLARAPDRSRVGSDSPYATDVDEWFSRYRDHEAVRLARRLQPSVLRHEAGVQLAVHLTDAEALEERVPFDPIPARLDRWTTSEARAFTTALKQFAADSRFLAFQRNQSGRFARTVASFREVVDRRPYAEWFGAFFGSRPSRYCVIPAFLLGGRNYGLSVALASGHLEMTPVFGLTEFDATGAARPDEEFFWVIVHEFCHAYANPIVHEHLEGFSRAGTVLFPAVEAEMRSQGYGEWSIVVYESVVRACVIRYLVGSDGIDAANRQARDDAGRGFWWIGDLASLFGEYESQRGRYADLHAFMPRVIEFFDGLAEREVQLRAKRPRLLRVTPADGAIDVDPSVRGIVIEFDRPMEPQYTVVAGAGSFPTVSGSPSWDADGRILTIPVHLQRDREYGLRLNSALHRGFRSRQGVSLDPVPLRFRTRE